MPGGEPIPWRLAIRDLVIAIAVVSLWSAANTAQSSGAGTLSALAAAGAGFLMSLVLGYLTHEWGHLAGAWTARARVHPSTRFDAIKLFEFFPGENSGAQFVWLTVGGLAALWLEVVALVLVLPHDTPGGIAAVLFAAGGAIFTTAKEAPIGARVAIRARRVARPA